MDESLETYGIWPINEYILWRNNSVVAQVACRPIYNLYTGSDWILGTRKFILCSEQDVGWEVEWPVGDCSLKK